MSKEDEILKKRIDQLEKENLMLREKMYFSNTILESDQLCVWILNSEFKLINFNQNFFVKLFPSFQERTITYEFKGNLMTTETQPFLNDCYKKVLSGESVNFELRIQTTMGIEWKEVFLNPVYNNQVSIMAVSGIAYNITDRKESRKKLAASEERFRDIFESFQDLYFRTDFHGNLTMLSPSVEEITGYTEEDLLDKDVTNFYIYDSKTKSLLRQLLRFGSVKNFQAGIVHKDGHLITTICNVRIIYKNGIRVAIEGVARDITELQTTTRELQKSKELAIKSLKVKERFLANISHEIRTPLNGVIGMLHLINEDELSTENGKRINSIRKSAELLLDVVNDLLDMSKIEAGKMTLNESVINVRELFDNIHTLYEAEAIKKRINLVYSIANEVPEMIFADEVKVVQIYANLISNALKFTEVGGDVAVSLEVDSELVNKKILLKASVADNGSGIAERNQSKLFKSFTQLDGSTTKQYKGTGLGLYLSKKLSEILRGDIGVISTEGEGSTFWFTFQALHVKKEFETEVESEEPIENLKVMVVDDNYTNREIAAQILSKIGCEVTKAENGQDAVSKAMDDSFDLIYMDIQMPDMDGMQATAKIKKLSTNSNTPIIAMTAYSMEGDKEKFLKAGMDDYIAKPINPQALLDSIFRRKQMDVSNDSKSSEVLNMDSVKNLLKYMDKDTLISAIDEFIDDAWSQIEELEGLKKDYGRAKVILHTLKGNAGTIGAGRLANFTEYLENEVKMKNYHIFEDNLVKLRGNLSAFKEAVKAQLI